MPKLLIGLSFMICCPLLKVMSDYSLIACIFYVNATSLQTLDYRVWRNRYFC